MRQIHFLVLSQNHFEINGTLPIQDFQGQFLDTVQVPIWDGNSGHPFPAVTLRMDFRGSDVGDFVYHCHIAGQEDGEMMAIIHGRAMSGLTECWISSSPFLKRSTLTNRMASRAPESFIFASYGAGIFLRFLPAQRNSAQFRARTDSVPKTP